ncbi:MAG: hypothetical protein Q6373_011730 [Candidatus Sigynarchaeota archaeon]
MRLKDHPIVKMVITPLLTEKLVRISKANFDNSALVLHGFRKGEAMDSLLHVLFRGTTGRFKGFGRNELRIYKNNEGNWSLIDVL